MARGGAPARLLALLLCVAGGAGKLSSVCVSELFPRLLDGVECDAFAHPFPWLPRELQQKRQLPRMAALNETLLSAERLYAGASWRACAGDPAGRATLGLAPGDAPPDFCVHRSPGLGKIFDQYAAELHLLSRWLRDGGARICGEAAVGGRADAQVVVVPSFDFHLFVARGRQKTFGVLPCVGRFHYERYWEAVRARFHHAGLERAGLAPPLIVTTEVYPWDTVAKLGLFGALANLPASFRARVVIAASYSNVPLAVSAMFPHGWRDGADAELKRREHLVKEGQASERAFGGPHIVSIPQHVGVARAADWRAPVPGKFAPGPAGAPRPILIAYDASPERRGQFVFPWTQYIRPALTAALREAGATCTPNGERCVLCAGSEADGACAAAPPAPQSAPSAPLANRTTARAQPGAASAPFNLSDVSMFALTARATFCVEPPGDVVGRSHAYVAMLMGCVPVLVDGGHAAYDDTMATWWPWRSLAVTRVRGWGQLKPGARPGKNSTQKATKLHPRSLDYSRFAVVGPAKAFAKPRTSYGPPRPSSGWVERLRELARTPGALADMRSELRRVLPFMHFRPAHAECAGADAPPAGSARGECPPDAFDGLSAFIERAYRHALSRLPRPAPPRPAPALQAGGDVAPAEAWPTGSRARGSIRSVKGRKGRAPQ